MNFSSTRMTVIAAFAGNLLIAITKFVAAFWTGSSAMLSEGFHSLVDTSNQALLLYGQKRAERPPDRQHPLGHGRELYFWSFVVAVLIFSLGAGLALYEGVHHVMSPRASTSPMVNYVVLGFAFPVRRRVLDHCVPQFLPDPGRCELLGRDPPQQGPAGLHRADGG
jgi:cation diffusion facilitator family transporter